MKSSIKISAAVLVFVISSVIFAKQVTAQQPYVSFQVFYDQLSPYGQWVDYPNYGYAWIPDAGPDFSPYLTSGQWVLTDYGWTWMSDYNWGWAPFHYGRWGYDNYYGWFWVPDYEWGPAWVSWRRAQGYYGWAPMEPGFNISISFDTQYNNHNDRWVFVRDKYIGRSDMHRHFANRNDNDKIIGNSTFINTTYVDNSRHSTYFTGPDRESVQKATGRKITPLKVQENDKPGQEVRNGQYKIYRPQVTKNNDKDQMPAPSRIVDLKNVKQPSERNKAVQQRIEVKSNTNKRVKQTKVVEQQNDKSNIKTSTQTQNADQTQKNRRDNQANEVEQPNNKGNNKTSTQTQNADQTKKNRREIQTNTVKRSDKNKTRK